MTRLYIIGLTIFLCVGLFVGARTIYAKAQTDAITLLTHDNPFVDDSNIFSDSTLTSDYAVFQIGNELTLWDADHNRILQTTTFADALQGALVTSEEAIIWSASRQQWVWYYRLPIQPERSSGVTISFVEADCPNCDRISDFAVETPRRNGESLFAKYQCDQCHDLLLSGVHSPDCGPELFSIGTLAAERVPGLTAEDYIYQSLVDPSAFEVRNFSASTYPEISEDDLAVLIAYLQRQR